MALIPQKKDTKPVKFVVTLEHYKKWRDKPFYNILEHCVNERLVNCFCTLNRNELYVAHSKKKFVHQRSDKLVKLFLKLVSEPDAYVEGMLPFEFHLPIPEICFIDARKNPEAEAAKRRADAFGKWILAAVAEADKKRSNQHFMIPVEIEVCEDDVPEPFDSKVALINAVNAILHEDYVFTFDVDLTYYFVQANSKKGLFVVYKNPVGEDIRNFEHKLDSGLLDLPAKFNIELRASVVK